MTEAPGKSSSKKSKYDKLFLEFWADIGDSVFFKNAPQKKRVEFEVIGIETNYRKVRWTKGGWPNFVHLRRKDKPHHQVWTCSNQLVTAGFKFKGAK